jgi:hypothetical protein
VNQLPPPHLFSDPNDRLLASVMPSPPERLGARARRRLQQVSSRELRQVRRWLRRGAESTTLLLVGLASFGVGIGAYLGVTTRGAPEATRVAGEARPAPPPEAILPLRANARVAALDSIPCATGPASPAPLVDDGSEPRTPAPRHLASAEDPGTEALTESASPRDREEQTQHEARAPRQGREALDPQARRGIGGSAREASARRKRRQRSHRPALSPPRRALSECA